MAYERVLAAFPRRPLAITKSRKPIVGMILAFLGFLLFAGLGAAAVVYYLPPLLNDAAVGESGVPVPGSWGAWRCTIHRSIVADCTIEAHFPAASAGAGTAGGDAGKASQPQARGAMQYREIPMLFFGRPDRNTPLNVVRDPGNPERVATSLGTSYLTDRWITLGVIGGILLALAIACLWGMVMGRRLQRGRRDLAAAPNPTVVTLTKVQRAKAVATWTFNWNAGAARFERKDNLQAPNTEPLILDPAQGLALALTDARGRAMLIDSSIANLQLTDAERQAMFDAIQRDMPRPPPAPQAAMAAR